MVGVDDVLPCSGMGVPDMLSAPADGPAVNVCGSSDASASFPRLNGLLTSLALSGVQQAVKAAGAAAGSGISPVRVYR
jgi:hypothetical protein